MSDADKERLLFSPETGKWSGYKHPYGFKVGIHKLCQKLIVATPGDQRWH